MRGIPQYQLTHSVTTNSLRRLRPPSAVLRRVFQETEMSTNKLNGAQIIGDYLIRQKVPSVFGLCGHGNIQFIDALYERKNDINTISVRHESVAGFMADVYYRVSGQPTATFTSCGPGSANLPISLANAFLDSAPFMAVTGNVPTSQFNRGAFQELYRHYQADFPSTVRSYCKRVFQPTRGEMVPLAVRQAWKTMVTGLPGPVVLDVPFDVFMEEPPRRRRNPKNGTPTFRAVAAPGLSEDAILVSDIGVHHNWLLGYAKPRRPDSLIGSMGFGPMGFGVAGVLGAKFAAPDRPCVSVCGDGAFFMHANVLGTAVEYDLPVVWVVEQLRLCVDPRTAARLSRRPRTGHGLPPSENRRALQSGLCRHCALRGRRRRSRRSGRGLGRGGAQRRCREQALSDRRRHRRRRQSGGRGRLGTARPRTEQAFDRYALPARLMAGSARRGSPYEGPAHARRRNGGLAMRQIRGV
jgi:Thiamine pyrophosphate enzyme, N-terminal TPP binding domain/Thiamine pyrophosphate enzyme, C-terminal TPP binding domain